MTCGKKLQWYELIPILSFLFQKGRCTGCKSKVSIQYPLVELLTGLLFLLVFNFQFYLFKEFSNDFLLSTLYFLVVFSILVVITVYDLRHKIIPDSLVFLFSGISLLSVIVGIYGGADWTTLLSGPLLATPFALLWLVSQGRWIGFGDAKLALGMGWFLGLVDGISAVILAFWIGAFVGVSLILSSKVMPLFLKEKHFTIKSEIPFAPFLILGLVIIFFTGWDILGLKLFLL